MLSWLRSRLLGTSISLVRAEPPKARRSNFITQVLDGPIRFGDTARAFQLPAVPLIVIERRGAQEEILVAAR